MQVRFQMHEESSNAIARTPPYSCDCSYIRWNSALFIDVARAESAAAQSGQERQRSLQKRAGTKGRSLRSTASHYAIHYILARGAMRVLSLRKCIRQGRQEAEADCPQDDANDVRDQFQQLRQSAEGNVLFLPSRQSEAACDSSHRRIGSASAE